MSKTQITLLIMIAMIAGISLAFRPWAANPSANYIAISDPEHRCLPWMTFWVSALPEDVALKPGDLVLMEPSLTDIAALKAVERPIAKFVLATPGAVVQWSSDGMVVDGKLYDELPHPALLQKKETRVLTDDEYVLVGVTDTSFDSRYFGPVPRESLVGAVFPILNPRWRQTYPNTEDARTADAIDFILNRRDAADERYVSQSF